jgi:hypothetical protein
LLTATPPANPADPADVEWSADAASAPRMACQSAAVAVESLAPLTPLA